MYSVYNIANNFIKRSLNKEIGDLTPMKLQRLLFLSQSWCVKKFKSRLFDDYFYRWKLGPVIPHLHYFLKPYQDKNINNLIKDCRGIEFDYKLSIDDENFIDDIVNVYGKFSGPQLAMMLIQKDTAWSLSNDMGTLITDLDLYHGKL